MSALPSALQAYHARVLAMRQSSAVDFPAHVHLETMARCNAACVFCPYPALERQGERMPDELIAKVIRDLEDIPRLHRFQLSPFKVNEPFLDVRLFDILATISERLPHASITLTTNASPLTERMLTRLAAVPRLGYLWVSMNDHREAEYERAMKLPYRRTRERLELIHRFKAEGRLQTRVVLSRVSDGTAADAEFVAWVRQTYPLFEASLFPRGDWLGQVDTHTHTHTHTHPCRRSAAAAGSTSRSRRAGWWRIAAWTGRRRIRGGMCGRSMCSRSTTRRPIGGCVWRRWIGCRRSPVGAARSSER